MYIIYIIYILSLIFYLKSFLFLFFLFSFFRCPDVVTFLSSACVLFVSFRFLRTIPPLRPPSFVQRNEHTFILFILFICIYIYFYIFIIHTQTKPFPIRLESSLFLSQWTLFFLFFCSFVACLFVRLFYFFLCIYL